MEAHLNKIQVGSSFPGTGKYYDDGAGGPRWEIEILTLEEYRAGLVERYQELLGGLVSEQLYSALDAFGPPVSGGKGKVALENQQGPGRLF